MGLGVFPYPFLSVIVLAYHFSLCFLLGSAGESAAVKNPLHISTYSLGAKRESQTKPRKVPEHDWDLLLEGLAFNRSINHRPPLWTSFPPLAFARSFWKGLLCDADSIELRLATERLSGLYRIQYRPISVVTQH